MIRAFRLRLAGAVLPLLVFAATCSAGEGVLLDEILARGELRVGVTPGFVPFVGEGGAAEAIQKEMKEKLGPGPSGVIGFDVELVRALAVSLGVRLRVEKAPDLASLEDMLGRGQVDMVVSGLTRTLSRARRFFLSDPYFVSGLVVLVPAQSSWRTLEDLNRSGSRVLVKPGATSEVFADEFLPKAEKVGISDEKTFGRTLDKGGCAAVLDAVKAQSFRLSGLVKGDFRRLEGRRFTDEFYGIVMRRDEALGRYVNLFLEEYKRSGRFHSLASRFNAWFRSED